MATKESQRVGYGNPPHNTRFKAGVSGNPGGRPKKIATLQSELLAELGELSACEGGEISNAGKIAKVLVKGAVGGNMRAIVALLTFCKQHSDADIGEGSTSADADIVDEFLDRELRRRAQQKESTNTELGDVEKQEPQS